MKNGNSGKQTKEAKKKLSEAEEKMLSKLIEQDELKTDGNEDILDSVETDEAETETVEKVVKSTETKRKNAPNNKANIGNDIYVMYDDNEIRVITEANNSEQIGGIKITSGVEIALGCGIKLYKDVLSKTRLPFALQQTMCNGNISMYSLIRLGSGNVSNTTAFVVKCLNNKVVGIAMCNARTKEYAKYTKIPAMWKLGIRYSSMTDTSTLKQYMAELLEIANKIMPGFVWEEFVSKSNILLEVSGHCGTTKVTMQFKKLSTSGDLAFLQGISLI